MATRSNEAPPLEGGTAARGIETFARQQNSFELFNNDFQMPSHLAGRSVSHEEGLVAMALLGCAGKKPPSRSSGGRVDSGAWGDLLAVGGENLEDLTFKHPDGGANDLRSRARSTNDPKEQRRRQEEEEHQQRLEMEELAKCMPMEPPFAGVASSRSNSGSNSSSSSSSSSSRKARFLSGKVDSGTIWPATSTDSGLNFFLNYKSSSGSGSSGGGGPPGEEGGGRGAIENAGGGRSSGSGRGGGGASWERAQYQAGGATTTHDDVVASNNSSSSSSSSSKANNSKFDFGQQQQHPLRQQSFQPYCEIADLPSAKDICPDQPTTAGPAAGAPASGGVQAWKKAAAAAATVTTTITTSRSVASSVNTNSSGVFVTRRGDHANVSVATTSAACPSNHPHRNHINTAGRPIAPAPTRRIQVQPPAISPLPAPVPVQHERKPSYNLLAMMIPDISRLGKPPTAAAPLHAPGAVPIGPAGGAAGFPAAARGFAPAAAAAAHFSPADSYLRVGVEDGEMWTRQAALARYRRKKKRRHLVKIMRENDPTLQEQNEARKRPRNAGKFTKERPDFVSICQVQKAVKSRSISGELPLRERESTTPPPQPLTRRGGGAAAAGRSAGRARSQAAAAGTRPSTRGGGGGGGGGAQEGSNLYMLSLTPSEAAKLGLK